MTDPNENAIIKDRRQTISEVIKAIFHKSPGLDIKVDSFTLRIKRSNIFAFKSFLPPVPKHKMRNYAKVSKGTKKLQGKCPQKRVNTQANKKLITKAKAPLNSGFSTCNSKSTLRNTYQAAVVFYCIVSIHL